MKTFPVMIRSELSYTARRITEDAIRYEKFIILARTLGLTVGQARAIFEHEGLRVSRFDEVITRSEHRVDLFAENGYLVVTLSEVLDADELRRQKFSAETILNRWTTMPDPCGTRFAEMSRDERRHLVLPAIDLAIEQRLSLERAVSIVMQVHLMMWDLASG